MTAHCNHPTDRPNFCSVWIDGTGYWFSYETCIAFQRPGERMVVRENNWGPTTGKHLNAISEAGERISRQIEELLQNLDLRNRIEALIAELDEEPA